MVGKREPRFFPTAKEKDVPVCTPTTARQGSITPLGVTDPYLDLEVIAERHEALVALEAEQEDALPEETYGAADETLTDDDPPF